MAFRRNAVVDLSSGGPQSYEEHARISTAKAKKVVFVRANLKLVPKDYDPRPCIAWDPDSVESDGFLGDEE